jgi:arylsulfatase A-like enzyme/Tfp pilus assembly protein PilF
MNKLQLNHSFFLSAVICLSFAFIFFLMSGTLFATGRAPADVSNVLLITVDTLRADRVSCYDDSHVETPSIDSLAEGGVVFTRAFANTSTTLPSHTNILLGVSPRYHGVHDNQHFVVQENFLTLAEFLKAAGYATGAFVGAFPLDRRFGLDQGFDVYDDDFGHRSSEREMEIERRAKEVVAKALPWVKSQRSPWFLWVHVYDPHDPYTPPAPYAEQYSRSPYEGEVAYVDEVLGSFFEELRVSRLLENTLVIFTGDHGESLGQHGEMTHGFFAYNTGIWIPLIVTGPGIKPGKVDHTVSHLDIFPTVCDVLKIKPPEFLQGQSLVPALEGRRFPRRMIYFESLAPHFSMDWAPIQGFIRDNLKFIESPIPELYDLKKDFDETENLASSRDLKDFKKRLGEIIEQYTSTEADKSEQRLDSKSLEKLQALGYTGGSVETGARKSYSPREDVKVLLPFHNRSEEAFRLYREGRIQLAIDALKQIITERDDLGLAYVNLAIILYNEKRQQEAFDILKSGFSTNPQSYEIFSKYVGLLVRSERFAEVLELFQAHYLKEMDHDPKIWNLLAMTHLNSGDPDGAMKALEQAFSMDRRLPLTQFNYGKLYEWIGFNRKDGTAVARSLESYKKAIELDPEFADAYIALGVVYLRSGEFKGGIYCLEKALDIEPDSQLAVYNLGLAYLNSGNKLKALQYFKQYLRDFADDLSPEELEKIKAVVRKIEQLPDK